MMKKYSIILIAIFIAFFALKSFFSRENVFVNDLFLQNIECLAIPENPQPKCLGIGSLDCPRAQEYKVKFIFF